MSSLVRHRLIRAAQHDEEVFVLGDTVRSSLSADGAVATVANLIDGAQRKAETLIAEGEARAAELVAEAEMHASAIRQAAQAQGIELGRAGADAEAASALGVIRSAAAEGAAIRDAMIQEAMPAIARAVAMATRRIVGTAYEADPSLVVEAVADAVRAAAGQQILAIRVSPGEADTVRAGLVDLSDYVRPDDAVSLGGCVIDLRNGTIDASLDARLDLMELAWRAAGGAE